MSFTTASVFVTGGRARGYGVANTIQWVTVDDAWGKDRVGIPIEIRTLSKIRVNVDNLDQETFKPVKGGRSPWGIRLFLIIVDLDAKLDLLKEKRIPHHHIFSLNQCARKSHNDLYEEKVVQKKTWSHR